MRLAKSLWARITIRMVLLQALTLLLIYFLTAVIISQFSGAEDILDDYVVGMVGTAIDDAVSRNETLDRIPSIANLKIGYPDLWASAVSESGDRWTIGEVPDALTTLTEDAARLRYANIYDSAGATVALAISRTVATGQGRLQVMTGGGPTVGPFRFLVANWFFVGSVGILALVAMVAVPIIVRSSLRGVASVTKEVSDIGVDERGRRLHAGEAPSELTPLINAFNTALSRLDDGIEQRERFLSGAAHELKTPIAILQTRIELLPLGQEREKLLMDVSRLANLAEQLLDLHRLDHAPRQFELHNLGLLVERVVADLAPLAIANGHTISFRQDTVGLIVHGDEMSLSRAFTNLVQNCIVHGGQRCDITVSIEPKGLVRIRDTGPGIPGHVRNRIFEPFYRVKPLNHGAGLGLSVVREVVGRHGGSVRVSDVATGAEFVVKLPIVETSAKITLTASK